MYLYSLSTVTCVCTLSLLHSLPLSLTHACARAHTRTHTLTHRQRGANQRHSRESLRGQFRVLLVFPWRNKKRLLSWPPRQVPAPESTRCVCVCVEHMHPCTHVFLRACMYACTYTTASKTRIVMASEVSPRRCTPTTRPPAKTPVLAPRPVDMTLASSCVLSSPRCRTRIRSVFASTSHKNKTKRARARGAATAD